MKKRMLFLMFLFIFLVGCNNSLTTDIPTTEVPTTVEKEVFLVQFLGIDGNVISVQMVEEGSNAIAPNPVIIPGYLFIEWLDDFSNVTDNLIIRSSYEQITLTVNYDSQGGNLISQSVFDYGSTITLPIPIKEGYNFLGWFLGLDVNSPKIYTGYLITSNITLYARWEKATVKTVFSEEEFINALNDPTSKVIRLGMDINITNTIVISRNISIYGDGYKIITDNNSAVFSVEMEDISFPMREEIVLGYFNIYDLDIIYDLDDSDALSAIKLDEVRYFEVNLDNVSISGDVKDGFLVQYSRGIILNLYDSRIDVKEKAFNFNDVTDSKILVDKSSLKASKIIDFTKVIFTEASFKDSDLIKNDTNTEESLAMLNTNNSGFNDFTFENTNLTTEMLSDSYVLKTTIEQGEQYFNFRGCNIEVNNPVYDDLFYSATFKTYIFFYDSVLVLQEGITEIPEYAFSQASDLGNFVLPSTLESIGDYAFAYLYNLYNVIIPEGVISIGHGAFKFSSNLMSVVIPDTVIYIGSDAFMGNNNSLQIYLFDGIDTGYWHANWNEGEYLEITGVMGIHYLDGVTYLALSNNEAWIIDYLYAGVSDLVIPESFSIDGNLYEVSKIETLAFASNMSLQSIIIPNTITSIGYAAFRGNILLETIIFADNSTLEVIGDNAFAFCYSLKAISIPASVSTIGDFAFYNNYRLETVFFEAGSVLTSIPFGAFTYNERLISVNIPANVTSIGYEAFRYCTNLVEVNFEIGSALTEIQAYAFYNAVSLKSFDLPAGVFTIDDQAFNNTISMIDFVIAENSVLTTIGTYAFYRSGISSINLPESVTYLASWAFSECQNLTEINIPAGVEVLEEGLFYNAKSLTTVTFSPLSELTTVGNNAFFSNYSLTNITLPDSVTSIGIYSFMDCISLTTFDAPNQLQSISYAAFLGCHDLVEFDLAGVSNLNYIGTYAFDSCYSLTSLFIPDTVEYIGDYAFNNSFSLVLNMEAMFAPGTWNFNWYVNGPSVINWAVNHRLITLEPDNSEAVMLIYEKIGTEIVEPTEPVRDGYIFGGWFEDDGTFLIPFVFDVMPEENTSLYAKWIPVV